MKALLGIFAFTVLCALPADAQGYFEGKTVTYIIATGPGGGYDSYARLIGKHLEKKLGANGIVFKNVPGAGHIIGANMLFASDPDGLTIGSFNTGLIYAQILQREGVRFDLDEFEWIGKASSDPRVIVLSTNSGLDSYEDLASASEPVRFASTGIGSAAFTETKMIADGLELNIDLIPGYPANEAEMAMLRGEIFGKIGSLSSLAPFVKAGNAKVVLGIGGGVEPAALGYAKTDKAKSIVNLIEALSSLGRLTAAPPGVPADVVEELRDAYMEVMMDPVFLEEAAKLEMPIDAARGDEVASMVEAALKQGPETVAIIAAAVDMEVPTVRITTEILALEDRNKVVTLMSDQKKVVGEISGSRTVITLDGAEVERDALSVSMVCDFEYDPASETIEFSAVSCASN